MAERKKKPADKVRERQSREYNAGTVKAAGKGAAGILDELAELQETNNSLLGRIKALEERLAAVETRMPSDKVIVLREISRKDAEKEISDLFAKGETLYYSDIAERLSLDLQTVVDICDTLQKRGEIRVDDNAL